MAYSDRDIPLSAAAELGYGDTDIPLDAPVIAPGRLSSALRAVIQNGYIPVIEIALPGGTVRAAPMGFSSVSTGHFDGKLLSIPEVHEALSDRASEAPGMEIAFEWADTDRTLGRVFEGVSADDVAGSIVTYWLAHPAVLPANYRKLFTGVLVKADFPEPFKVAFSARTDDLTMTRLTPKAGWSVTKAVWSNAHADALGSYAPTAYGYQDSQNYEAKGMVEALYADIVLFKYILALGRVGVGRVYADGVAASPSSYSVTYPEVGGRLWTVVTFTGDQAAAVITADVTGYDLTSSAGGTVGTNPVDQLAHVLSNLVLGDWAKGDWLATSARIDSGSFSTVATKLGQRGFRGGRVITDAVDGYAILSDWLGTFWVYSAWNPDGELVLILEDPCDVQAYPPGDTLVSRQAAGYSYAWDDQGIVTAIQIEFNLALGDAKSGLEVMNPKIPSEAADSMAMPWLAVE